ncbi:hypothetical protein B6S12_08420 [Helicobacter valdiviensis]|uniref:Uncharacterized protein n=1 Tax=Helicobacter valdiviensis TaxID=1458358 RepID=A0A2W6MUJ0_9HELI|nr:hypothetical protein [Helicobacter valdiviensis]PZT47579.1 hypothetical protein B6S12_08420 [Helicobacter valdiviensis]
MTGGWGFLAYVAIFFIIFFAILSFLSLCIFFKWQSFRNFLCSKNFWIAWGFPYLLLFVIICVSGEWSLSKMYISSLSLPLVYFLRKAFIQSHSNLVPNEFSLWIIPISICSFFIHIGLFFIYWILIIYLRN